MINSIGNKKRIKNIIIAVFLIIFASNLVFYNNNSAFANSNKITAKIVMDADSKRVLYSENANIKMYMASTTKIVTCLTIIENCNTDDYVTVPNDFNGVEGSSIYLKPNEVIKVEYLLYGLMLRSGNDCAEVLAKYCSKSIKDFAILMNNTAKKYGLLNSNFVNPHGLHDDNHYTTAYDLALISSYAMQNEQFKKIVSTKRIIIEDKDGTNTRLLVNKNKMLSNLDGADGIKTGYTKNAGRCLVTSCVRNSHRLISVVLNCVPMWDESKAILENTFNSYNYYKLVDNSAIIGKSFVKLTNEFALLEIKNSIILPLKQDEYDKINIKFDYPAIIDSYNKGENIGKIDVYIAEKLIFSEKIYIL